MIDNDKKANLSRKYNNYICTHIRAPKYIKEIDRSEGRNRQQHNIRELNTLHSKMDRSPTQKFSTELELYFRLNGQIKNSIQEQKNAHSSHVYMEYSLG